MGRWSKRNAVWRRGVYAAALLIGSAGAALADPPARVGRLSYIDGTVSFHTSDQSQWSPATLNYPVTTGDSFYTDTNARAEIEVGPAVLRLDQLTAADIARLDDAATQIELDQGDINIRLGAVPSGGVAVLTPEGQVDLLQPGVYDINAGQPNGDQPPSQVQITVLQGGAQLDATGAAIASGQSALVAGNPATVTMAQAGASDFDAWAADRDRLEQAAQAPRYVSPQMTGYEDLDVDGQWAADPTYGEVWYPSGLAADWQPYRYGHWAYVAPWGWTWIDDAPWGFAPFHYGRWAMIGSAWAWVPGAVVAQPVYAPALVGFIGGDGWGVTIGAGAAIAAIGWVALAPGEVYHPSYRTSVGYVRTMNGPNVNRTVINKITTVNYANVKVSGFRNQRSATVVPAAAFTHAAPVQRATLAVPQQQLGQALVRPALARLQPTAAARAGVAQPLAATALVARPNMPAAIARGSVAASTATPRALASITVPKAPGPAVRPPAGRPGFRPTPAAAPATTPRAPAARPATAAPSAPGARPPAASVQHAPPVPGSRAPTVHVVPPPGAPAAARPPATATPGTETRRAAPATPSEGNRLPPRPPTPAPAAATTHAPVPHAPAARPAAPAAVVPPRPVAPRPAAEPARPAAVPRAPEPPRPVAPVHVAPPPRVPEPRPAAPARAAPPPRPPPPPRPAAAPPHPPAAPAKPEDNKDEPK